MIPHVWNPPCLMSTIILLKPVIVKQCAYLKECLASFQISMNHICFSSVVLIGYALIIVTHSQKYIRRKKVLFPRLMPYKQHHAPPRINGSMILISRGLHGGSYFKSEQITILSKANQLIRDPPCHSCATCQESTGRGLEQLLKLLSWFCIQLF